jgi:hypothetical protein
VTLNIAVLLGCFGALLEQSRASLVDLKEDWRSFCEPLGASRAVS